MTPTELNRLSSAKLRKLLQFKNVPGRSKLARKTQQVHALEGIVTEKDVKQLKMNVPCPREKKGYPSEKIQKTRGTPGKGKRINEPVGGMDVHRDCIMVAVASPAGIISEKKITNNQAGINDLLTYFIHHNVKSAALESTAEYWLKMFWKLSNAGMYILVANPLQTRAVQGVKTDTLDARRIALGFRDGRLKQSVVCTADQYVMRKLNRNAIKKTQEATKKANQIKAMLEMFDGTEWVHSLHKTNRGRRIISRTITLSDQQDILYVLTEGYATGPKQVTDTNTLLQWAKELTQFYTNMDTNSNYRILYAQLVEEYVHCQRRTRELRTKVVQCISKDTHMLKARGLLLTVPNVGIDTALTIIVELVDIRYVSTSKGLVKWAGLAPRVNQSGHRKRQTGRIYKGGNKWLRRAVWIVAKNCYAYHNKTGDPIGAFIDRLFNQKHKHYFTSVTAGARKLLTYIYQVLKQQKPFEEIFKVEHLKQLKKNRARKHRILQRILKDSSISELLPILAHALQDECVKLEQTDRQFALQVALKLGIEPYYPT